jgi:hypothetical protein
LIRVCKFSFRAPLLLISFDEFSCKAENIVAAAGNIFPAAGPSEMEDGNHRKFPISSLCFRLIERESVTGSNDITDVTAAVLSAATAAIDSVAAAGLDSVGPPGPPTLVNIIPPTPQGSQESQPVDPLHPCSPPVADRTRSRSNTRSATASPLLTVPTEEPRVLRRSPRSPSPTPQMGSSSGGRPEGLATVSPNLAPPTGETPILRRSPRSRSRSPLGLDAK